MRLLDVLAADLKHYISINDIFFLKPFYFFSVCLPLNSLYSIALHRFVTWTHWKFGVKYTKSNMRTLLKIIYFMGKYISVVFRKIEIEEDAQLGQGIWLSTRGGILLGAKKIGNNCMIHHNVTIGYGFGDSKKMERPTIGNDVCIESNTVIYGNIRIGDGVYIKANSVVHKNIPPNSIVYGNPSKIIRANAA